MGSNYFHKISSFELVRDPLFFKFFEDFSNVKAFECKFFEALEAWFVKFQLKFFMFWKTDSNEFFGMRGGAL